MNLLAILTALGLEQWRAFHWRVGLERLFVHYVRRLERNFNGGRTDQGVLAAAAALAPPVLLAAGVFWVLAHLHPLLGFAWNAVVLYALMGFRRFSHAVSTIIASFREGDVVAARRSLASWRGGYTADLSSEDIARLATERGLVEAYRQVFAVLFWFTLLPGPAGAVLYRAAVLLADEWRGPADGDDDATPMARALLAFGAPARRLLALLDWVPVRLTALSFAIVGDFEDAAWCWRTQAKTWAAEEGGAAMGIVLASGAGALGVELGGTLVLPGTEPRLRPVLGTGEGADPDLLPSAVGLVWRALILWLLVILLVTLAHYSP